MPDSIWHFVRTANQDLCQQLYDLTGWDKTHQVWNYGKRRRFVDYYTRGIQRSSRTGDIEEYCEVAEAPNILGDGIVETASVCAYDLGYSCSAAAGAHRAHQCLCGVQRYVPEGASA